MPHAYISVPYTWVFHGFLCDKALIEDADSNLFFCDILFDTSVQPFGIRFSENLNQASTEKTDKITKLQTYSRDAGNLHALVLRASKSVDFYFNGAKLFSSTNLKDEEGNSLIVVDIGITSDHIYLRTDKDTTYKLNFDGKKRVLFSEAKKCKKIDSGNWNRILHERVRHERIELFFDFKLSDTNLYVTYDRFTSSFDLLAKFFKCQTAQITDEAQYLLGISKDNDTVGLFQEASDP